VAQTACRRARPARAQETHEGFKLRASLRPALKHEDEVYAAPRGGEHLDALPAHLAITFRRQALSGEDISEYRFGFVDGEGNFLSREDALRFAIKSGLIQAHDAGCGTLTSSMIPQP
jgi:hypothetical protein